MSDCEQDAERFMPLTRTQHEAIEKARPKERGMVLATLWDAFFSDPLLAPSTFLTDRVNEPPQAREPSWSSQSGS